MLLGLSGSIGVHYFVDLLLFGLKETLAKEIRVIQTPSASRILDPRVVSARLGCDVWTDPWDQIAGVRVPHRELAEWADLFLVMPATAHTLASAAQGHTGTLLTLAILMSPRPVGFVPNMNMRMWQAPSTQRNVAQLRQDGHLVLDKAPESDTIERFALELAAACSMSGDTRGTD
jgi:phosphopantothenoylcysteine decarboxylase/phosphopantothenate--cysteine ligase